MEISKLYGEAQAWLLHYGPRMLIAALVMLAGQWLLRMFRGWLTKVLQRRKLDASLKPFLLSLLMTLFQILLILGTMQILGIQMTVFAALVGGIGVAVGLALSGTLQNFTSGILILILKPYRVGDNILAQGQEGTVTSIQIFYTIVVTFDNKTVIIPNSKLSNEVIINLSREGIRRLDIEMKLKFDSSFDEVKAVIEKTIHGFPGILQQPAPRTGVIAIEADGYKITVQLWIMAHGFIDARLMFQENLIKDLAEAGIKM